MNESMLVARAAVEALRSGVPSRHAVARLGTTQDAVATDFAAQLDAASEGQAVRPALVGANFGGGKSHLLNYLRTLAERRGYVTSFLVVSPETPPGNAHVMLRAIVEDACAPGKTGQALREMAMDMRTDSVAYADLRRWAGEAGIDERFQALLHLYDEFRADEEFRVRILDDIQGKPIKIADIKARLREIGEAAAYAIAPRRTVLLAHDRIRLLAQFLRACGAAGLVVLIDEVERLRTFTLRQRLAAYDEIGWWCEAAAAPGSAILPVFAYTSGFVQEVITGDNGDEQRVLSPSLPHLDADADGRRSKGIAFLKAGGHRLLDPTAEQLRQVEYRVRTLYEEAYGERITELPEHGAVFTTVRAEIRCWITEWDLHRYDPSYSPEIVADEMRQDDTVVPDDVLSTEDEPE